MSTPAQQREAERLALAFHLALVEVGTNAWSDSFTEWEATPPVTGTAATTWITRMLRLVRSRRPAARALGLAYYRLNRALMTGYTVSTGDGEVRTDLNALRRDFDLLVSDGVRRKSGWDGQGANSSVRVEPVLNLEVQRKVRDKEADEILVEALEDRIVRALEEKERKRDKARPADVVDKDRASAETTAADVAAGEIEASVLDAGRDVVGDLAEADRRVVGWVRISLTGTPCGFCAMLISRAVFYKSEAGASTSSRSSSRRGLSFHPNCHCIAIEVYSRDQFKDWGMFALNREYTQLWNARIRGKFTGNDALNEWRSIINARNKALEA